MIMTNMLMSFCYLDLVTRVEYTSSSISTSQIGEPSTEESFMSDDMSDDIPMSVHSTPKSTATSSPALAIVLKNSLLQAQN